MGSRFKDTDKPASRLIEALSEQTGPNSDRYHKLMLWELETFLADNLLQYTDGATMATGLEARVPLLNHKLVELSTQIPFRDKVRNGTTKYILIDAFKDLLPESIVKAPKRGFSPPIAHWMKTTFDQYFKTSLTEKRVQKEGIFSWNAIQQLRIQHQKGIADRSIELLMILMFDVWHQKYILGKELIG